jgi:hypothetical protein
MKKIIALSSVMLGVVFLAGCGQQQAIQTQPTAPAPVAQTPTQPVPIAPAVTQNYVEVKELGMKIPVSAELNGDISYKIAGQGGHFFSKKLSSINKECDNKDGVVYVTKYVGQSKDEKDPMTATKYKGHPENIKQFQDFFLYFDLNSNYCVMGTNYKNPTDAEKTQIAVEDKIKQDILSSLRNSILIGQ